MVPGDIQRNVTKHSKQLRDTDQNAVIQVLIQITL